MLRALTIIQPWASLIVLGHKRIENRTWSTSYRGRLLIHAGKKGPDPLGVAFAERLGIFLSDDLPCGAIIGECELIGCITIRTFQEVNRSLEDGRHELCDWVNDRFACGPFCWLLKNARRYDQPIPCRGALGLWTPPSGFQTAGLDRAAAGR